MATSNTTTTTTANKDADYGLASVKFQQAVANGFPTSWDDAFSLIAMVKDNFNFNDAAPSETNIEVEDMDEYYATLESDKGSKGFVIQTYDMGEATYKYLCGYAAASDSSGWLTETPGFKLANQAVQVITKTLGTEFRAKQYEWANMKTTVVKAGTIGKSGFPNFTITCTKQALLDANGKEIAGARWKFLTA
jgi:hypothetical protein